MVEGELGRLAGVEDDIKVKKEDSSYTDPDEVEEFVSKTGVDSLAIAIGTSHGAYKFQGEAKLRFDILEEVQKRLPGFPIVLLGASSVIPEFVEKINKYGGKNAGAQEFEEMLKGWVWRYVDKYRLRSEAHNDFIHKRVFCASRHLIETVSETCKRKYQQLVKHKLVHVLGCDNTAENIKISRKLNIKSGNRFFKNTKFTNIEM